MTRLENHPFDLPPEAKPLTTHGRGRSRWGFLIVEAILIIASILAAFAIEAWWSDRQEDARRVELLSALREDFTATARALDSAIESARNDAARTGGYLDAIAEGDEAMGRDSLLYLLDGVGAITFFEPPTASYRAAASTGDLDLIRTPDLLRAFTEFDLAANSYEQHLELSGQVFYLGAVHDLRAAIGGYMFPQPEGEMDPGSTAHRSNIPRDYDLRSHEAVAAAEAVYWLHDNILDALVRMKEAADRVVIELDGMLD